MPSGERNVFRIELVPDYGQRKAWKTIEQAGHSLYKFVLGQMIRSFRNLGIVCAESLFLEAAREKAEHGPLLDVSVLEIVHLAHEFLTSLCILDPEDPQIPKTTRPNTLFEVPKDEVTFSASEMKVRVPYLGIVRYKQNRFITWDYANLPAEVSEQKAEKNIQLRRTFVGVINNTFCLVMDCSPPGTDPPIRARSKSRFSRKRDIAP